jgi:hypothetical protein
MNKITISNKVMEWAWCILTLLCLIVVIILAVKSIDFTSILALGIGSMAMWRINIIERKNKDG